MNVTRQDIDALNAKLKVVIAPEDYKNKVNASLEKYRKTAKIPGFRPGHVPAGMIQKQYGKSVLAEELNKMVNDALYKFIQENKLDVLGNPIPNEQDEVKGDFEKPETFEFTYDIGFAPKVKVELSAKSKFDYVKIKVDKNLVDKQIEDLRRRYGKMTSADTVTEKDLILGQFVELNEDGSIKEGGILHSSTVSTEFVEDAATKKELIGKKVSDKLVIDPRKVSRGGKDTASMLGISEETLAETGDKFQLMITEIKRMEMAELDQEFFDKLYGPEAITSEEDMRQKIATDLENMFVADSDRLLTQSVYNDLIENTKIDLPDDFMKRWIRLSNEKPITPEEVESAYPSYAKNLKWQLIQTDIFKSNDIKLDNAEVIEFTKMLLIQNYAQYGMPAPDDKELTDAALGVLKNKDEANRVFDMMAEQKLTNFFKNTVKLKEKEVSYDEFVKLAN
ncbi:MAG: trigger factor [Crocinitomicaceae bacterium]